MSSFMSASPKFRRNPSFKSVNLKYVNTCFLQDHFSLHTQVIFLANLAAWREAHAVDASQKTFGISFEKADILS